MAGSFLPAEPLQTVRGLVQAGKFGLVGVSNTFVDAGLYFLLSSGVVVFMLPRLAAKAASYLAGVANSYYWNRRWTFQSQRPAAKTFVPFLLTNLAGMGLNILLLRFSLEALRLREPSAVAAATIGAVLWNFLINKYVVFRKPGEPVHVDGQTH